MKQVAEASWAELLTGRFAPVSAVLSGGIILHAVNTYISATMLPSIVAEIGGRALYAWNTSLFILAAILTAAITGKLLARFSPRMCFGLAGLVFILGSGVAAIAPNMPVLLVGRAIQGAGGGMIFTLCYSMIVFVYPEKLWSRAMALLSGTWGIATLLGPAVGGIFAELDMWRAGFGVLLPVTALYIFLTSILLPSQLESSSDYSGRIPVLQLMLLAGAVIVLSVGGASSSLALNATGAVLSVVLIYLLVRREQAAKGLLFPNAAFEASSPLFLSLAVMALLIYGVNAEFFMPYFLQVLHGFSPLWAGYVAALVAIGWAGSEVLSARLVGYDMHRAVMAGPLLMVAGMMLLALFTPLTDSPGMLLNIAMGLGLIIVGVGIGIGWPHLSTFALQFTPDDEKESAASALSTVQMFAIAFGTAIAGMIANLAGFNETDGTGGVANAALALFASFGVIALLGVFLARTLIYKHVRKDAKMSEAPAPSVSG